MPQLWTETIVTQYFWLVVILFGFYYIAVVKFIPQIAFTLKARRVLETAGVESKKALTSSSSKEGLDVLAKTKTLISSMFTTSTSTSKSNTSDILNSNISTVRTNWINKHIK